MKPFAALLFTLFSAPVVVAQHQTFAIDPAASEVKMKLITTHEVVNGSFHVQSGSIEFDRSAAKIAGIVVVAAESGKTGNEIRDKKMNNILKADQYTTVTFAPKSYTGTIPSSGDSTIQVSGVFTLLGSPHDVTIPMQIHTDGSKAIATSQFTVPYVQWGLKSPSFLMWKADNSVAIDLSLVGNTIN